MSLQIGDKVKFLNESGEGTIVAIIDGGNVKVLAEDSFEYSYPISELIKVDEEEESLEYNLNRSEIFEKIRDDHRPQVGHSNKSSISRQPKLDTSKINTKGVVEVDLHLEELVKNPSSVKEWQKIEIQIDYFRACMNEAIEKKISEIVFIHGKGQGRLKEELRAACSAYPGVEYHDADFNRYGFGATHIYIRGLYS